MVKFAFILSALAGFAAAGDQLKIGKLRTVECDRRSTAGDKMTMHYRGTLLDGGKQFDASYDRNSPFTFTLGVGQVIKGWDQGLQKMCPGDKRKLTIPPHLGYGDRGAGRDIPGGAWLVFEVECLSFTGKNGVTYDQKDSNEVVEEDGKEEL